jgi:bifunctional ADP-heptose synthase (sugar kinase/adenylyltransferase)
MKSLRLGTGTAVLSVLAAALRAATSPDVARGLSNCTASRLVPGLGDVTVNEDATWQCANHALLDDEALLRTGVRK